MLICVDCCCLLLFVVVFVGVCVFVLRVVVSCCFLLVCVGLVIQCRVTGALWDPVAFIGQARELWRVFLCFDLVGGGA